MTSSGSEQVSNESESSQGGEKVRSLLRAAIDERILPGACVLASVCGDEFLSVTEGNRTLVADGEQALPLSFDTVFDLGRLTQSVCVATLMMRLVSSGKISPTDRATRYLQTMGVGQKARITLAHLLSHTAGFPAGGSVYDELVKANAGPRPGILASGGAKQYAYNHFQSLGLRFEPGARELHSDINYIILGNICEVVTGLPLEKAFVRYVAAPVQLASMNFIDLTILRRRRLEPMVELFAPMGTCNRRERVIAGEVWDENAWVMGGVAGHAGLFGTINDLHKWGQQILDAVHGRSQIIAPEVARMFLGIEGAPEEYKGFGFMSPSKETGFISEESADNVCVALSGTGSSVLIDCARELIIIFLGGVSASHQNLRKLNALRSEVHAAIVA